MMDRVDVFPRYLSNAVTRLTYPKKNFENFKNDGNCKVFVPHLDVRGKMYYYKLDWTEKYFTHMLKIGKDSQHLRDFKPNKINWVTVARKLEKDTSQQCRINTDTRIGFKNGDKFLVKSWFTFGQRTVDRGTAHFIQTLNVPLVFYLMTNKFPNKIKLQNGTFPHNHMHLYDRRVLLPNGCYRLPPGTTYILMTTQKNFFSLNIIDENDAISIPYTDPVATRVTKLVNIYDKPMKTPYIEDMEEEEPKNPELEALFKTIQPPSVQPVEPPVFVEPLPVPPQQPTFIEPQQPTYHEPPQQPTFHEPPQQQTFHEPPQQPTFHEPQQTFHEPILNNDDLTLFNDKVEHFLNNQLSYNQKTGWQRNVSVASLEFVEYYRMLMHKQMDDPKSGFFPSDCGRSYPMDLTISRIPDDQQQQQFHEMSDQQQFHEMHEQFDIMPQQEQIHPEHFDPQREQFHPDKQHLDVIPEQQQFHELYDQQFNEIPDVDFNNLLTDLYDVANSPIFENL